MPPLPTGGDSTTTAVRMSPPSDRELRNVSPAPVPTTGMSSSFKGRVPTAGPILNRYAPKCTVKGCENNIESHPSRLNSVDSNLGGDIEDIASSSSSLSSHQSSKANLPLNRITCSIKGDWEVLPYPGEICDACPHCLDLCSHRNCSTCNEKLRLFRSSLPVPHDNLLHDHATWPPSRAPSPRSNDDDDSASTSSNSSSSSSNSTPSASPLRAPSSTSTVPPPPPQKTTYTPCEVRRHNTMSSCWIVVSSEIYDVTAFLNSHPGGVKSLLRYSGGRKDCASDMKFHSASAVKKMKRMKVGRVVECPGCGAGWERGVRRMRDVYKSEGDDPPCVIM
eukprot:CAMPEP_0182461208 /NCGR_PEP_ID=MMETSP1319-20130603/5849_1 /TAXON_ID=172717 /ORGANISM="Bolidomonas pacifica, Strain RCC208" /LENGTH=334 /DNA_ID=CAMNT_0024660451 /DNA_START=42 /DNA_END=1046 /DNA_ORIENTATION=-